VLDWDVLESLPTMACANMKAHLAGSGALD
jgi:hypothetical protein